MRGLRPEEEWVRQMLQAELGMPVSQHDDGSRAGMHDLKIALPGGALAAVEVVAAADSKCIELWNLINGGDERWQVPELRGGWLVRLAPNARANTVHRELPSLLRELESRSITQLDLRHCVRQVTDLDERAHRLSVKSVWQSAPTFPGSIYVTIELPRERAGGMVPTAGQPLADWLGRFLAGPDCEDVRAKLLRSEAPERHAFVLIPGFSPAPFAVGELLISDGPPLPTSTPDLPYEVTHVWAVSTWSCGHGIRWSPDAGWGTFAKEVEENSSCR